MRRVEIRGSRNLTIGWVEDDFNEVRYFGYKSGYVGRFDKNMGRYFYMKGPQMGQVGPWADIGTSEVIKFEEK